MTVKRKAGRPSNNESRRNEILVKATECFTKNGYSKTTLDEIGEALGFNKAALYYYFKDKEALFKNVVKLTMLKIWEEIKAGTLAVNGLENKILKYFEIKLKCWLVLLNINGISRENLLQLNESFSETILQFRESEIAFLKDFFLAENTKYNENNIEDFLNLLIDTQTDVTMCGILINDIINDSKMLEETKKMKEKLLIHFLKSFHANYIPD